MSPRRGRPAKRRDATASGPVYQMDEHANVFQRRLPLEGCLSEIDWPTELRKVVREFDGLPPEPSPGRVKAKKEAERRAQERRTARIMALGALARLLLVAALGAAVVLWPYRHDCRQPERRGACRQAARLLPDEVVETHAVAYACRQFTHRPLVEHDWR